MNTDTTPAAPKRVSLTLDIDAYLAAVIAKAAARMETTPEVAARALILNSLHGFNHTVAESNGFEMLELVEPHATDDTLDNEWIGWGASHLNQ